MSGDLDDILDGLSDEQLAHAAIELESRRSNAAIDALFPRCGLYRDVQEMSTEELSFELLEGLAEIPPEDERWRELWAQVRERHATRDRGSNDYTADDDPRLSDPVDLFLSDCLRGLLGHDHDKVRDPALLLERYRSRLPDRVLAAAYFAASRAKEKTLFAGRLRQPRVAGYSTATRARLEQLAGLPEDRGCSFDGS